MIVETLFLKIPGFKYIWLQTNTETKQIVQTHHVLNRVKSLVIAIHCERLVFWYINILLVIINFKLKINRQLNNRNN